MVGSQGPDPGALWVKIRTPDFILRVQSRPGKAWNREAIESILCFQDLFWMPCEEQIIGGQERKHGHYRSNTGKGSWLPTFPHKQGQ